MEESNGSSAISTNPKAIKAAQDEMGKLDVLVCGQCHSVFHFIEEFQEHRTKEGACSKVSSFRESANNDQKAQVWAFLLWKDTQLQQENSDKESPNSWKLYQQWCKMDNHTRECWVNAGKTIQTFTKLSNAKLQDVGRSGNHASEGGKTTIVRKVIKNGNDNISKSESTIKKDRNELVNNIQTNDKQKSGLKPSTQKDDIQESGEEYVVEKILAKRFNPKKKCHEYLLKWEGYSLESNTWEPLDSVNKSCRRLVDEFEQNLAKTKETKTQQNTSKSPKSQSMLQKNMKIDNSMPGPSSAAQAGRPMRSSKSKAMDQVKQWCGSMNDDIDHLRKRKIEFSDSDSEDDGITTIKRLKSDLASDEEWTGVDDKSAVKSDVIQKAYIRANAQTSSSTKTILASEIINSNGKSSISHVNAKKLDTKQSNTIPAGVYYMHKKDGVIKLDSSPTNKIGVKGSSVAGHTQYIMVKNKDGSIVRKQVITTSMAGNSNSVTPVKVAPKADGTQVVTQMKVVSKGTPTKTLNVSPKSEPVKIQPKPEANQVQQIQLVTAIPTSMNLQTRNNTSTKNSQAYNQTHRTVDGRQVVTRIRPNATVSNVVMSTSNIRATSTPVRAQTPRQTVPQNRQIAQKRVNNSPGATIVHVSSQNNSPMRTKTTNVINKQGNILQKTAVNSPAQTKSTVVQKTQVIKTQTVMSPQQKLMMAKKKAEEQAGVINKAGRGAGATSIKGGHATVGRGKGKINDANDSTSNKPKEKIPESNSLHMEFHQEVSEDSSSEEEPEFPPISDPAQVLAPDSPPSQFTLCPLTGRIIGPDGQPEPESEPQPTPVTEPTPTAIAQVISTSNNSTIQTITDSFTNETTELVIPSLESLTESTGGIMRVEMSPGGTTGMIVQTTGIEVTPTSVEQNLNVTPVVTANATITGLPCLDDAITAPGESATITQAMQVDSKPVTEEAILPDSTEEMITSENPEANPAIQVPENNLTVDQSNLKMDENPNIVTIAGDDGAIYHVAGQSEDGQLIVTRGDGEQLYLTTEQPAEEGSVLTLDHVVAEAVSNQAVTDQNPSQFYLKEGETGYTSENQVAMSTVEDNNGLAPSQGQEGEGENQAQVLAQVIQADEPTPDGTRRVVLLLADGSLMMTEVDEEQYAALELDK